MRYARQLLQGDLPPRVWASVSCGGAYPKRPVVRTRLQVHASSLRPDTRGGGGGLGGQSDAHAGRFTASGACIGQSGDVDVSETDESSEAAAAPGPSASGDRDEEMSESSDSDSGADEDDDVSRNSDEELEVGDGELPIWDDPDVLAAGDASASGGSEARADEMYDD